MKIVQMVLRNFASIYAGMGKTELSINFSHSIYPITLIVGKNGSGKTSILSNMHPFPYVESGDVRNKQDLIIQGKDGYKFLDIIDGDNEYYIHIYYILKNDKRITKCYIAKNGRELNQSGAVRTYYEILKTEFGIEPSLLRIIRLGPNVADIISMNASERKDFISGFLQDIYVYEKMYETAKDESIYLRNQLKALTINYDKLESIDVILNMHNKATSELNMLMETSANNSEKIGQVQQKRKDMYMSDDEINRAIKDYDDAKSVIEAYKAIDNVDEIRNEHDELVNEGLRINADKNRYNTEYNECKVRIAEYKAKLVDYDTKRQLLDKELDGMETIDEAIKENKAKLEQMKFDPPMGTLETYINIRNIWNKIIEMIKSMFDINVFNIYRKELLYCNHETVLDDLREHIDNAIEEINRDADMFSGKYRPYSNMVRGHILFIPQGCVYANVCPFYNVVQCAKDTEDKAKSSTAEGLKLVLDIYKKAKANIDVLLMIKSNINTINDMNCEIYIDFSKLLNQMVCGNSDALTSISDHIDELYGRRTEANLVSEIRENIKRLESRKADMDNAGLSSIKIINDERNKAIADIDATEKRLADIEFNIDQCEIRYKNIHDKALPIFEKYDIINDYVNNINKYKAIEETYTKAIDCSDNIKKLDNSLALLTEHAKLLSNSIADKNSEVKNLAYQLQYKTDLDKQIKDVKHRFEYVELVKESLSSTKGIPLVFIQLYLKNIQVMANNIIRSMFNDDDIELLDFVITDKEFSIPYRINGIEVMDAAYSSQGERATIVLALSFALLNQLMGRYNIMLLDEIDSPLYKDNRRKFIKIIEEQMKAIGCEQAFIITHNNLFENYPTDIIYTSEDGDTDYTSGNVIFRP